VCLAIATGGVRWRAYLYAAPAAVWAGVLLALALARDLGPLETVQIVPQQDKLYHFVEYFVLAALIAFALVRTGRWVPLERFLLTVSLSALYGLLLEALQAFVPGRSASALDAVANTLGAIVGAAILLWAHLWLPRRRKC
jgi:VanZ family protein